MIFSFPARFVLAFLLFSGLANFYAMRVNMSIAIVAMVNNSVILGTNTTRLENIACQEIFLEERNRSLLYTRKPVEASGTFDWDAETQSYVLSSIYFGYVVAIFPGGFLLQRFGVKWIFGFSVLVNSILTLLTPLVTTWGVVPLIILRAISGAMQGTMMPAKSILISNWVPVLERSRIISIVINGSAVGTICGMMLSGVIADSNFLGGWPAIFYFFGAAGCIWFLLWIILAYETPSEHPWIKDSELTYIQTNLDHSGKQITRIPWRCILGSSVTWVLVFTSITVLSPFYTVLGEIPTYLSSILHYDIETNGYLSAVAQTLKFVVSFSSSHVADKLREKERFNITTIRKIMHSVGCFIPSVCYLAMAFSGCRRFLNVFLYCCAVTVGGFSVSGYIAAIVDVNPTFSGITTGLCYMAGSLGGILGMYAVGKLTSSGETTENWNWVFLILAGCTFLSGVTFVSFGTAELQQWGTVSADVTKPPAINEELPNVVQHGSVSASTEVTSL